MIKHQGHRGHEGHKGNQRGRKVFVEKVFVSFVSFVSMGASLLAQVSPSRLASNATDAGNWLMYSGSYTSHRFSPLDQISPANVSRLKPLWIYQPPGVGSLEGGPPTTRRYAVDRLYVSSLASNGASRCRGGVFSGRSRACEERSIDCGSRRTRCH